MRIEKRLEKLASTDPNSFTSLEVSEVLGVSPRFARAICKTGVRRQELIEIEKDVYILYEDFTCAKTDHHITVEKIRVDYVVFVTCILIGVVGWYLIN